MNEIQNALDESKALYLLGYRQALATASGDDAMFTAIKAEWRRIFRLIDAAMIVAEAEHAVVEAAQQYRLHTLAITPDSPVQKQRADDARDALFKALAALYASPPD